MTYDYDTLYSTWHDIAPPQETPPVGTFPAALNFMADEVWTYHNIGDGRWAEVSYGSFGGPKLGVSVARSGPGSYHSRSEGVMVFDNPLAAARYINNLRVDRNADWR